MNFKRILPVIGLSSLLLTSCDDQVMDWYKDPAHGEITTAELPLELIEKISRYDVLKTYTDFKIGVGVGLDLYMNDETYRNIANENFDDMTVGYAMKHGAMVNSQGEINFANVDEFLAKTKEAGLSVFGHTLVWHSNQNASYLNALIAPTVIPGASGANLLVNGDFDENIDGWSSWGGAKQTVEYAANQAISGSGSLKAVTGSSAINLWDLEIQSGDIPVVTGHRYQITFFIKSEGTGHVRLAFNNMNLQYPGIYGNEAVSTSSAWQQISYNAESLGEELIPAADATTMNFRFDLGSDPNMTYYIDHVIMVDLDAESQVNNLIPNGTFDDGLDGWSKWNGNAENALSYVTGSDAYEGDGAMKVINDEDHDGSQWNTQIHSDFTASLTDGETYTISFMIRSESPGSVRCSTSGDAQYQGDQSTLATWSQVKWEITSTGGETGLNFDLGLVAGTYYIDNVVVTSGEAVSDSEPTVIERTDEEKTGIIEAAMEDWISKLVTHYKDDVHAWDAVNEPMLESGEVRNGDVSDPADDEFYWVKYLGKDYAVTAFNLARQYGNTDDKLFINDYNLESNMVKLDGLISYVQYIESQGATIDGIGTQMHISTSTDKDLISEMFRKLAASGKLIKISELDVRLGTNAPTAAQLEAQADMYQYVLEMYSQYIPVAQQYGVTIWGISDNEQEHEYWLPDESPNLWDANYNRKHAYKGVADGLAGRDVSEDFSGELQY